MALLMEHGGKRPRVHASAYVAPNAVLCGDVVVGANSSILFGAVLTSEGGTVELGNGCIVMENAVLRSTQRHPLKIGDNVLIGPHAHLTGCTLADNVFVATGASIFNGAFIGDRSEVRINAVVHVNTVLERDTVVPIGWVAVGDPAEVFPPEQHERIWAIQKKMEFARTVFGLERAPEGQTIMPEMTRRYGRALARHKDDKVVLPK